MEIIVTQITTYLQAKASEAKNKYPSNLRGWAEETRLIGFEPQDIRHIIMQEDPPYSRLLASVFKVTTVYDLTLIMAIYKDGTILWLDDHSDDEDYKLFISREALLDWLPEKINEYSSLFIETKLNFLGEPRLISSITDIPPKAEHVVKEWTESPEGRELSKQYDNSLNKLIKLIYPPKLTISSDGLFSISLFVWTRIIGFVYHIQIDVTQNVLRYNGLRIEEGIGHYFVPR